MNNDVVKKPLTILIADGSTSHDYLKYLDIMFDVKVVKFEEIKGNHDIDLVLFTGGEDVNPSYYNQNKGTHTFINKDRDKYERNVFDTFYHKPKLGICRGAQFLTVMSGGELVQHVTGHTQEHLIFIENYGDYVIPSTHHQMMYPFKMDKEQYQLIGYASKFRSTTYLDGDDKEIKLSSEFLEPEIIQYKNTNSFCIQGHPEFASASEDIKKVTLQLILNWLDPKSAKSPPRKYTLIDGTFRDEPWIDYQAFKPTTLKTKSSSLGLGLKYQISEPRWNDTPIKRKPLTPEEVREMLNGLAYDTTSTLRPNNDNELKSSQDTIQE